MLICHTLTIDLQMLTIDLPPAHFCTQKQIKVTTEVSNLCFSKGPRQNKQKKFFLRSRRKGKAIKKTRKQRMIVWKPLIETSLLAKGNERKKKQKEEKDRKKKLRRIFGIMIFWVGLSFARPLPPNAPKTLENTVFWFYLFVCFLLLVVWWVCCNPNNNHNNNNNNNNNNNYKTQNNKKHKPNDKGRASLLWGPSGPTSP